MNTSNPNMHSVIQRIATGPELSKNISFEEAREAMAAVLDNNVSPVQSAIFLIALRMKRETDDENRGVLQAIIDSTEVVTAKVDEVLDITDPFNGQNRGLPVSAFLSPLLAACGVPAFSHGLESVGPKYGITHRKVLAAAGKHVDLSPAQAAAQIENPDIGWAYIDQKAYSPKLHDLVSLRAEMIKRTVVTTVEEMVGPIRGRNKTHLLSGYVHKAYPPVYASLAKQAGFDTAMIIRGIEGSVIPSLKQPAKLFYYQNDGELNEMLVAPAALGIDQPERCVPLPGDISNKGDGVTAENIDDLASLTAEAGLAALNGKKGAAYDSLAYIVAIVLVHLNKTESLRSAYDMASQKLDSGDALKRFNAA
ncbi:MAG: anthranilate phosphoribosyltransferase [Gammaproteobacteria bacterium]|nr:MAG: anthranilate phosphoribosyltransferase [Gammaproteobacteria bacterium]